MSHFRLAIVRQKYRPDGGAERFVSRALEALEDEDLQLNVITRQWQGEKKPDWHLHLCHPRYWTRVGRERGFANAARALWQKEQFDLVQSHERIAGCDIYRAGDGVHRRWLMSRWITAMHASFRWQAIWNISPAGTFSRFSKSSSTTLPAGRSRVLRRANAAATFPS